TPPSDWEQKLEQLLVEQAARRAAAAASLLAASAATPIESTGDLATAQTGAVTSQSITAEDGADSSSKTTASTSATPTAHPPNRRTSSLLEHFWSQPGSSRETEEEG
ncbi:hypothetical protein PENTCL1PPCAC_11801, partial [Pristionchus entomophagus]